MSEKRRKDLPAVFILLTLGFLGVFALGVRGVGAGERASVTNLIRNENLPDSHSYFMRLDAGTTGNVAYCAQHILAYPTVGMSYERHGSPGIPELDYVMYHGYDGVMVKSLSGLSASKSENATAYAIWLAIGDQRADLLTFKDSSETFHGNTGAKEKWENHPDKAVRDAAWKLYQESLAYKKAGAGGIEAGCATLWLNPQQGKGGEFNRKQSLLTVTKKITATFTKTSANAAFTSGNDAYSLEGAAYDIFRAADKKKVGSIVMDKAGKASLALDAETAYYAVETKAPRGFTLNIERVDFKTGKTGASVKLSDVPGTATVRVVKHDAATDGAAQAGLTLAGAVFEARSLAVSSWTQQATTDDAGRCTLTGAPLGETAIREVSAPDGYLVDPTEQTVSVTANEMGAGGIAEFGQDVVFSDTPVAFDIEISKFLSDGDGSKLENPGAGISFEILSRETDEVLGSIETDEDGHASTKGLWLGAGERPENAGGALPYCPAGYEVREDPDTTPEGYTSAEAWIIGADEMANGATLRYIVANDKVTRRLRIMKRDAETDEAIPLAGFRFQILDAQDQVVSQEVWYPSHQVLDEFTTDDSGCIELPEALGAGSYRVRESGAAAPYLADAQDASFTVSADSDEATIVVEMRDTRVRGRASITKTCATDGEPLAGARYEVIALEDIVEPDGSLAAASGQVIGEVSTGKDGTATIEDLSIGCGSATYAFREIEAPSGHVLDDEAIPFTLSYADQETAVVSRSVSQENVANELVVEKSVLGKDAALPGATFALWDRRDEISVQPADGFGAVALRGDGIEHAQLAAITDFAEIRVVASMDYELFAVDADGARTELLESTCLPAGSYRIAAVHDGQDVALSQLEKVKLEPNRSYDLEITDGLLGINGVLREAGKMIPDVGLSYDQDADALMCIEVPRGRWRLEADGAESVSFEVEQGKVAYFEAREGSLREAACLLQDEKRPRTIETDGDGLVRFDHLAPGVYRLIEEEAPAGFLRDGTVREVTVGADGRIEGSASHTIVVENDFTKVEISKRDLADEEELPGAELELRDAEGNLVERWTSTDEPHRIEALAPGRYTLIELLTPREHDMAQSMEFEVLATGDVQAFSLYDKPIEITGQVDKRQEIAQPTRDDCVADVGDGDVAPRKGTAGLYDYGIDFRSTANTWTDECTLEDRISAVDNGLAELTAITTPVAQGDRDGRLNVWYKTVGGTDEHVDEGDLGDNEATLELREAAATEANATLDDGHENPWLSHEVTRDVLGDDGRALDYEGWKLWARDVASDEATRLEVEDLELGEGERVVAIRLEYGCVDAGFTTRQGYWDRDDLKDSHDDVDLIPVNGELSPLVLHMRANDTYATGTALENACELHLYRNGGGEGLEDHDHDRVVQTPRPLEEHLDQTGVLGPAAVAGAGGGLGTLGIWLASRRGRLHRMAKRM